MGGGLQGQGKGWGWSPIIINHVGISLTLILTSGLVSGLGIGAQEWVRVMVRVDKLVNSQ